MRRLFLVLTSIVMAAPRLLAYDLETHRKLSLAAGGESVLPSILSTLQLTEGSQLAFDQVTRKFNDGSALGWVQEGAVREDGESACDDRVRNHFYNPIDNLGYMRSGGLLSGIDSALWGLEDTTRIIPQNFSYHDAKDYFWNALMATTDANHQRNLALTFRSLGQVIHLVQDDAQPQHTRNDSHAGVSCPYTLGLFGPSSVYEEYVEGRAIVQRLNFTGYPVVAFSKPRDFWDTEDGRGMAEFSNRNFVTAGTNFTGTPDDVQPPPGLPSPNAGGAQTFTENIQTLMPGAPLNGIMTFIGTPWSDYYTGFSGYNTRTSTYSLFTNDLARRGSAAEYSLNVFNYDNAQQLLIPRAVGYSAGMLNYFFRGTLSVAAPDRFAYLLSPYPGDGTFTKLKLKVRDDTAGADTGVGTLYAIIRYRTHYLADPLFFPSFSGLNEPSYAISKPIEGISLSRDFQPFTFDFSDNPVPLSIGDVSIVIAFRGPLIAPDYTENDAIAFGGKDVFEPQLITFGNSTDYDCYQDALYDVVNRTAAERDLNGDGIQDLFGPAWQNGSFVRDQSPNGPVYPLDPQTANYQLPSLSWAQFGRFVAVQDQPWYRFVYSSPDVVDSFSGARSQFLTWVTLPGAINRILEQDGKLIHEVGGYNSFSYRGTTTPIEDDMVNYNILRSQTCMNAMPTQPRPMTEVPGTVPETN